MADEYHRSEHEQNGEISYDVFYGLDDYRQNSFSPLEHIINNKRHKWFRVSVLGQVLGSDLSDKGLCRRGPPHTSAEQPQPSKPLWCLTEQQQLL